MLQKFLPECLSVTVWLKTDQRAWWKWMELHLHAGHASSNHVLSSSTLKNEYLTSFSIDFKHFDQGDCEALHARNCGLLGYAAIISSATSRNKSVLHFQIFQEYVMSCAIWLTASNLKCLLK